MEHNLIKWKGLLNEEATWDNAQIIYDNFSFDLKDKIVIDGTSIDKSHWSLQVLQKKSSPHGLKIYVRHDSYGRRARLYAVAGCCGTHFLLVINRTEFEFQYVHDRNVPLFYEKSCYFLVHI